ncbi:MAG: hypothetical protein LBS36_11480 [Oscillospiraceae bacterium]|jgi:amidase|nr:hypothetical protein [Oscillospiraceae bacterium]
MDELHAMCAAGLKRVIQEKRIGVEELTRSYLRQIEQYDIAGGLNTIAQLNPAVLDQARQQDAGFVDRNLPLFGLPILVKDNIDVAGLRTTAGSLALNDNVALTDAPVIANLRRSGALILGKTNMTEFANYTARNMPNGYSSRGGKVRSAYNRSKDPGGSSTGSAVAVSAGFCAAAIGTDTLFSILGCAVENGVVGLKPPHKALSAEGIVPIAHTLDSAGPLTRTFLDALLVYAGMRGVAFQETTPTPPSELRIAVNIFDRDQVSQAQLAYYEALFHRLRAAGAEFSEIIQPSVPYLGDIMRCEFRHDLEDYLAQSTASLKTLEDIIRFYESNPKRMMQYGISSLKSALIGATGQLDDAAYLKAMTERERIRSRVFNELSQYDACIMTGPTNIMHFVGLPCLALKLCMASDNTPRGVILYGADENKLYMAALAIENYCLQVLPPEL